jgi:hypothetical protein
LASKRNQKKKELMFEKKITIILIKCTVIVYFFFHITFLHSLSLCNLVWKKKITKTFIIIAFYITNPCIHVQRCCKCTLCKFHLTLYPRKKNCIAIFEFFCSCCLKTINCCFIARYWFWKYKLLVWFEVSRKKHTCLFVVFFLYQKMHNYIIEKSMCICG